MATISDPAVTAHEAAETLTYALLSGDAELADEARRQLADARSVRSVPDASVRRDVVEHDPVTAAAAGWLPLPELAKRVLSDPAAYLAPDEAAAVARDAAMLRVVVLARVEGRNLDELQRDLQAANASHEALAARGDATVAKRVWAMLRQHGIVDPDSEQ